MYFRAKIWATCKLGYTYREQLQVIINIWKFRQFQMTWQTIISKMLVSGLLNKSQNTFGSYRPKKIVNFVFRRSFLNMHYESCAALWCQNTVTTSHRTNIRREGQKRWKKKQAPIWFFISTPSFCSVLLLPSFHPRSLPPIFPTHLFLFPLTCDVLLPFYSLSAV